MSTRPVSTSTRHRDRARPVVPIPNMGASPSGAWAEILGLSQPDTIHVDDTSVRGLPALDRARAMVTNAVATMMCAATVTDSNGMPLPVPTVVYRPHPLLGRFEFYSMVADLAIMHGNFVGIRIGEDPELAQILPVPLGAVTVDASSGLPVYTIEGREYQWYEILHVRSNAPIGTWWGVGVVEKFRRSLSEQLYGQAFGENSFKTGAVPSMTVQLDVDYPTIEQTDAAKSGIMTKLGSGKREPLVHGKAMTLSPVSWSPHDAEFIEARKLSSAEAALMVGLRPEDIGATLGEASTYGNRTDDSLQRITDSYGPWMSLIEGPFSDLLDPGQSVNGNPEALLRTSTRERLELRQLAQAIGVETAEESRVAEGRTPLTTVTEGNEE